MEWRYEKLTSSKSNRLKRRGNGNKRGKEEEEPPSPLKSTRIHHTNLLVLMKIRFT